MTNLKPHCLNCATPYGPYIYCKHLAFRSEDFDITGETQACIHWTRKDSSVEEIQLYKGLRLTRSEDGIFLHFEVSNDRAVGVRLDKNMTLWRGVAHKWATGLLEEAQKGNMMEDFKNRNKDKVVNIAYPQSNDNCPYFLCPACNMGNITIEFNRCVDCGARVKWVKRKVEGDWR